MDAKIVKLVVRLGRVDPAEAEIFVDATPEPGWQIAAGRIVGPRCPGRTTVEVAYPLRLFGKPLPTATLRAVISEPSFHSEAEPFVYRGYLRLLDEKGQPCEIQFPVRLTVEIDAPPK